MGMVVNCAVTGDMIANFFNCGLHNQSKTCMTHRVPQPWVVQSDKMNRKYGCKRDLENISCAARVHAVLEIIFYTWKWGWWMNSITK